MEGHHLINQLCNDKYLIFNVDDTKRPVDCQGNLLIDWINASAPTLSRGLEIAEGYGYGMNVGLQGNGQRVLSLDFDVCGDKDPDGKRLGCPETLAKLEEYRSGIDRVDGMYSSSTAGNFNVLVDYTECPEVASLVKQFDGNKFTYHHLEIILRGNQVIPPTATMCKMTSAIGEPRTFLNSEPFYKLTDQPFMLTFLKGLFTEKLAARVISTPPRQIKDAPREVTDDKWLDLLFNIIRNQVVDGAKVITWDYWFKIAGILKSNKYELATFLKYSLPVSTESEATKLWECNRKIPPMSLYGLQNIAKEVNPFGYRNWITKHQQYIPLAVLAMGENDVARYISEQLRGSLVYCDGWWRLDKNNLWVASKKAPLATVITHLQTLIDISKEAILFQKSKADEARKLELTKMEESYADFYYTVGSPKFSNHIAALLVEYLAIPGFDSQLNSTIYTVAYKNGILDLKTLQFREGIHASDMLSQTLDYDYEVARPEDVAYVREQFKKICNYDEVHTEYYLGTLGYALTGDSSALCELYYLTGQTASNGKSTPLDALTDILPIYVCRTEKTAFDEGNSKVHKEIATWGGKRIVWANEVSAAKKNSELLKELTDGAAVKYDKLYSTNALMRIQFKLFLVSNNSLSIKMDAGINRRFRHFQMDSKFLTPEEGWVADRFEAKIFKKDPRFGTELRTTYRAAFLHLLFSRAKKFHEHGLATYPVEWKAERDAVVEAADTFREFFDINFEVRDALTISKQELDSLLKPYGKVNIRDELKRLNIPFEYQSQQRKTVDGVKHKGIYRGFGSVDA